MRTIVCLTKTKERTNQGKKFPGLENSNFIRWEIRLWWSWERLSNSYSYTCTVYIIQLWNICSNCSKCQWYTKWLWKFHICWKWRRWTELWKQWGQEWNRWSESTTHWWKTAFEFQRTIRQRLWWFKSYPFIPKINIMTISCYIHLISAIFGLALIIQWAQYDS